MDTNASGLIRASVAQADLALGDADQAIDELSRVFIALAAGASELAFALEASADDVPDSDTVASTVKTARWMRMEAKRAVEALQFHDRLEQRLRQICRTLEAVADGLEDHAPAPGATWTRLAREHRERCITDDDRKLFDDETKLNGGEPAPARPDASSGVELF